MNRSTHDLAGGITGFLSTLLGSIEAQRPIDPVDLLSGWVGGVFGSRVPDALEPATSPNHRKAAHAVVVTACVYAVLAPRLRALEEWCRAYAVQVERTSPFWALAARFLAGFLCALIPGYGSHLALDATTPKGLPLLGV